jgi:uridine kinase
MSEQKDLTGDLNDPRLTHNPDIERAIQRIRGLMKNAGRPILVALDGRSGTGKSTIARFIASQLSGVEVTADDFWVGGYNSEWDTRTPREKAEKAIDWQKIRAEVLEPLLDGRPTSWHPFNWAAGHGLAEQTITAEPKPLIVLDGAYSTRPELSDLIDLGVLVKMPNDSHRRNRLIGREGREYMADWHNRWDVAEDYYFTEVRPKDSFDMIISNH